ncbi:MAG: hypothetical protein ACLR8Y_18295 [Alistipes indistinctus]
MVTSVTHLTTKTGKPYGRFTIEDYNSSHEFVLFSKDYENFRRYLYEGYLPAGEGACAGAATYNPSRTGMPLINSMMMLSEARETLIRELTIALPVAELTEDIVSQLKETINENRGNVTLRVKVLDPQADVAVNLYSKTLKVGMTPGMVRFLDDNALRYTLM